MPRSRLLLVLALLPIAAGCASGTAVRAGDVAPEPDPPASARDVVALMRDAYDGRWYETLEFRQRNTAYSADGTERDCSGSYVSAVFWVVLIGLILCAVIALDDSRHGGRSDLPVFL